MAWFHDLIREGGAPGGLPCGGRLLAELLLLAKREGFDLGPPTAPGLGADEIERAIGVARALGARWQCVPGAPRLDALLEGARGGQIALAPPTVRVERASWLDDALAFYRPLGLFVESGADELAGRLDESGVGEGFAPSEEIETTLLELEPSRTIELSGGASPHDLAGPVLEGLARACRGVTSLENVEADWPERDESGDFTLGVRLRLGGREVATYLHGYRLKYPRWDVFVDDVNRALAPTGRALWAFSQGSHVALLSGAAVERIAALRGVVFAGALLYRRSTSSTAGGRRPPWRGHRMSGRGLPGRAVRYTSSGGVATMSFARNPHVAKAEAAEQKAQFAKDAQAREQAFREAARQWERAAERENDDGRRRQYAERAEAARANADNPRAEGGEAPEGDEAEGKPPTVLN